MSQYRLSVGPWGDGTYHVSASPQIGPTDVGGSASPCATLGDLEALESFLTNKLKLDNAQLVMRTIRDGEFFSAVVELSDQALNAIRKEV
jgi:hypothetical protein